MIVQHSHDSPPWHDQRLPTARPRGCLDSYLYAPWSSVVAVTPPYSSLLQNPDQINGGIRVVFNEKQ